MNYNLNTDKHKLTISEIDNYLYIIKDFNKQFNKIKLKFESLENSTIILILLPFFYNFYNSFSFDGIEFASKITSSFLFLTIGFPTLFMISRYSYKKIFEYKKRKLLSKFSTLFIKENLVKYLAKLAFHNEYYQTEHYKVELFDFVENMKTNSPSNENVEFFLKINEFIYILNDKEENLKKIKIIENISIESPDPSIKEAKFNLIQKEINS